MRTPRDPQGIDRAKRLRREMSMPERALWALLRAHRLDGWKFTKQVPEGPFVIDFAARQLSWMAKLTPGASNMTDSALPISKRPGGR